MSAIHNAYNSSLILTSGGTFLTDSFASENQPLVCLFTFHRVVKKILSRRNIYVIA